MIQLNENIKFQKNTMILIASWHNTFFCGVSLHNQTFNQILGQVVPHNALKLIVAKFDQLS